MTILLRLAFLVVGLLAVTVGLVFLCLTWLPAFILFGERGMDRVMDGFEWIVIAATDPFAPPS